MGAICYCKALVLDQNGSQYKVRMLDWTEEDIEKNRGFILIGENSIIKE